MATATQLTILLPDAPEHDALHYWSEAVGESRGEVFTKPEVADFNFHNLYFVTAREWDLRALQTVLRSRLANAFVATYSLRMRGDCLRFQAQYLRRIRLPRWADLSPDTQAALTNAAEAEDNTLIDETVRAVYGLDESDWNALCGDPSKFGRHAVNKTAALGRIFKRSLAEIMVN